MPTHEGRIWAQLSGRPREARVHVLASSGQFRAPDGALRKVGDGELYVYREDRFRVEVVAPPRSVDGSVAIHEPHGPSYETLRFNPPC